MTMVYHNGLESFIRVTMASDYGVQLLIWKMCLPIWWRAVPVVSEKEWHAYLSSTDAFLDTFWAPYLMCKKKRSAGDTP